MSLGDEHDLRQRLSSALETITPPPAPVHAVVRKGKAIRVRRRIGVAAALAAVVAIVIGAPALLHHHTEPPVTRHIPPQTVISSGTINGKAWRFIAYRPGLAFHGQHVSGQCFTAAGAGTQIFSGGLSDSTCPGRLQLTPGTPGTFAYQNSMAQTVNYAYGVVAPDVTRIDVTLSHGQRLTLLPVQAYGQRLVAFAFPEAVHVLRATAYSGTTELAYAIPYQWRLAEKFGPPLAGSTFGLWLRPGQPVPPRGAYPLGHGSDTGQPWSATMDVGPWGYCVNYGGGEPDCVPAQARNQIEPTNSSITFGTIGIGSATPSVAYATVTFSNGSTRDVRPVDAGGPRFYVFEMPRGVSVRQVTYYSASGSVISSQRG